MKQQIFCKELQDAMSTVPASFHQRIETFLSEKVVQEESRQRSTQLSFRMARRAIAIALAALLVLGTVAVAAAHWGIFDALGFMLGGQPVSDDMQMAKILHQETIGNKEITILEAGYDGRTLLLQYSCRNLDGTKAHTDWWTDHFWINGQSVDMPADSGSYEAETETTGEVVRTDYIRLDNESIQLSGQVTIGLPLWEMPDIAYFKSLYNSETDSYAQPDQGLVVFSFDTGDVLSKVETLHPNVETVTDIVTVKATEAAFSSLMTYITLELSGNADALDAYKAQHGEGYFDENGTLVWLFTSMDVHSDYLLSLTLVDENGVVLFPDYYSNNGMGETWAEFLFPYIAPEKMPNHLYLAPVADGVANMNEAIFIR